MGILGDKISEILQSYGVDGSMVFPGDEEEEYPRTLAAELEAYSRDAVYVEEKESRDAWLRARPNIPYPGE